MNDYSNSEVGLPQGSPISPVLIQSFLHQLDLQFDAMAQEENGDSTKYVYFARYADDILFGIPIVGVGVMSKVFFRRLQEVLDRMSSKLRLKLTSIVLQRWILGAVRKALVLVARGLAPHHIIPALQAWFFPSCLNYTIASPHRRSSTYLISLKALGVREANQTLIDCRVPCLSHSCVRICILPGIT